MGIKILDIAFEKKKANHEKWKYAVINGRASGWLSILEHQKVSNQDAMIHEHTKTPSKHLGVASALQWNTERSLRVARAFFCCWHPEEPHCKCPKKWVRCHTKIVDKHFLTETPLKGSSIPNTLLENIWPTLHVLSSALVGDHVCPERK